MKRKENKRYIMQKAQSFSSITRCYATLPPKPPTYRRQVSRSPHTFVIHLFQCRTCQITKTLKVVDSQPGMRENGVCSAAADRPHI